MNRSQGRYRIVFILTAPLAAIVIAVAYSALHRRIETARIRSMTSVPAVQLTPFQRAVETDLDRQVAAHIRYQDGYFTGGDPPADIGVCTDVAIRSYLAAGVDLQALVQKDIRARPASYHITRPDPNIDHRRCRNLAVFFRHTAVALPTSGPHADWQPGDIVLWDTMGNGVANHIGVIATHIDPSGAPTVVHHWPGQFVMEQDWLYRLPVLYHFRWKSEKSNGGVSPSSIQTAS
jgi:hypothetical protein